MGFHRTGRWQELSFESDALRGNPLGDPVERLVYVWTPPSYDHEPERRYPSIYLLHGLLGQGRSWFNVAAFARNVPELVDGLGVEAVLVAVDGFTALGGAQWIDSPAIGRYGSYLCDDVVAFVDSRFRTLPSPAHRGVTGKSSGGFGAMVAGMKRPDVFGAFATHAGDALFEVSITPEFGPAAQLLRNRYDGSFERFWESFRSGRPILEGPADATLIGVYVYAAAYSSRDDGTVELPFRLDTGELVPEVWQRWLAWDPVRLAGESADALRAARGIWIDAGRDDDYRLDLGAVAYRDAVLAAGAAPGVVHFELFDGTHRNTNWRYPLSIAFLAERLAP
jgi:S-formylglutathione hydrolase FrmB